MLPAGCLYKFTARLKTWGRTFSQIELYILLLFAILTLVAPRSLKAAEKIVVNPSGVVSWHEMVESQQESRSSEKQKQVVPFMPGPSPRAISGGVDPSSPTGPPSRPLDSQGDQSSSIPVTKSFQALDDNNSTIPPDTMGAAGPNHLMTMLNSQVRIQNKSGSILSTVLLDTFWTSGTGLSGDPFDPRIIFDSLTNRWMATIDADSRSTTSAVWFAVSDDDDPTGSWTFYAFDADAADTDWADFPDIGTNSTWVAITNNMYTIAGNSFTGCKMWVIDKSTLGGALTMTEFATGFDTSGTVSGFTLRICATFDASESTLYIVDQSGYVYLGTFLHRLSRITGTGASPSWSVVPGSTFASTGLYPVATNYNYTQIDASQLGTATEINTNDPRLQNAVLRNGRVWYTHSAGLPVQGSDRTAVFWYEVDPSTWSSFPASPIVQSGVEDGGTGVHHFFPSIAANKNNDAALGFSRSDATRYAEAVVTGRLSSDPAGTMDPLSVIKAGEDSYVKDFDSGRVRWGDYSATVVDPSDDRSFWTIQEYAAMDVGQDQSHDRWGTWWARIGRGGSFIAPIYPLLE